MKNFKSQQLDHNCGYLENLVEQKTKNNVSKPLSGNQNKIDTNFRFLSSISYYVVEYYIKYIYLSIYLSFPQLNWLGQ